MRYRNFLSEQLPGFYSTERAGPLAWKWQEGAESIIEIPAHPFGYELRFEVKIPGPFEAHCKIVGGGKEEIYPLPASAAERVFKKIPLLPHSSFQLHFCTTATNSTASFAPGDDRDLGLCFTKLEIIAQNFLQAPLCPMPFTRMELHGDSHFVPCCSPWLTEDYHSLSKEGEDPWNGSQAQALRESILDGDYRYCRRDLCHTKYTQYDSLESFSQEQEEFHFSPESLTAIKEGNLILPGPSALTFLADARCNLACGSCRTEMIHTLKPEAQARLEEADRMLKKYAPHLHRLRLAGDGEALFSPYLRSVIQSLNEKDYPALKIAELHTNGLLLTEKNLESLAPGSRYLNRILLSIDAGDEATYKKVRGGDWKKLLENLRWISSERNHLGIETLVLLFVYREENLASMEALAHLGKEMKVDGVFFSPLLSWERMAIPNYESQAVHLPTHPMHGTFLEIKQRLQANFGSWLNFT